MAKTMYRVMAIDVQTGHWISVGMAEANNPKQAVDIVAENAGTVTGLVPGSTSAWAGVPEGNWSEFDVELPERPALKTTPRESSPTALGLLPKEPSSAQLTVVPPFEDVGGDEDVLAEELALREAEAASEAERQGDQ